MTAINEAILAGLAAGGTGGTELANFANIGTALPTSATAVLDAGFRDAGWISEDGLKRTVNEQTTDVNAYGSSQPVRVLKTSRKVQFDIAFLQSGPTQMEIYHQLPLGSLVPSGAGAFDFVEGPTRTQRMSAVFTIVDGTNRIRAVVPSLEVTGTKEFDVKKGTPIVYGVTITAYPGSDGTAIHWYYIVPAVA